MAETSRGRVRVEDSPKWVRVHLGGEVVADTRNAKLVWEVPYFPQYYFPRADVRNELLVVTDTATHSPSRGDAAALHRQGGRQRGD